MSVKEVTVLNPGTSEWNYVALNKAAFATLTISSIQLLETTKLNLHFVHIFFSPKWCDEENKKILAHLVSTLKSVAVNIKANVIKLTAVAQRIDFSYDTDVPIEVDKLTSRITEFSKNLIEILSMPK